MTPTPAELRDGRQLAAIHAHAAHYLVTDDARLRKRARRAGLGDRVISCPEAAALLQDLEPPTAAPPPRVHALQAYELELDQPIFATIRNEYGGNDFDSWMQRVQADSDNRYCFVIVESDGSYSGIAIVKRAEDDCAYELPSPVSKISTFKVAPEYARNRYGELLLKAVMGGHVADRAASTYVEVFPHHVALLSFLGQFGFTDLGVSTERDERVLAKWYQPPDGVTEPNQLDFHIRFGPPAVAANARVFVVPIQPRWHRQLFPGVADRDTNMGQLEIDSIDELTLPWGNAIRKAYLCHCSSNQLRPGDVLLFYRSTDSKSVSVIGVLERADRMTDPGDVLSVVTRRTVYSQRDVVQFCNHPNGLLVMMFRHDRTLDAAWSYDELVARGVLKAPPQTTMKVKEEGTKWVLSQLVAQP